MTLAPIALLAPLTLGPSTDEPYNLLVILTDQHNARMIGADANGHGGLSQSLTPHLDALAAEGVRYERAYCTAQQCMPSRYSILTGRYPHTHGLRWNNVWEPRGELTLPELARRFGYATGNVGKHHMHWLDQVVPEEDHGFDVVLDLDDYADHCAGAGVPYYSAPGNYWPMPGLHGGLGPTGFTFNSNEFHPSGWIADRSIEFLDARAGPGGDGLPFVLWCSFQGPHTPILPSGPAAPQDWAHMYHPWNALDLPENFDKVADMKRLQNMQANFAGMTPDQHREALSYYYGYVTQIDHNVGRVLARLDALGLADRTVVVFMGDHGEFASEMAVWTKGGGAYEALSRVPLIVRAPGALPAGRESKLVVDNVDLFPTLVKLLGLTPEPWERARLDGESFVEATLRGPAAAGWDQEAFLEFGSPLASTLRHRTIVTPLDKYTYDEIAGGQEEYFYLADDPWEERNRAGHPAYQSQVARLRARLAAWWNDEEGHAPLYRTSGQHDASPARADDPFPPPAASGVRRDVDLAWLPATSAAIQNVYLGKDPGQLALVAALPAMADGFNPGVLLPLETYYWRVDGVNGNGTTPGDVWTFRTATTPGGPRLASAPSPGDGVEDVPRSALLSWTPGAGAASQDVWFAREGHELAPLVFGVGPNVTSVQPPELLAGVRYRWRVDGHDAGGTAEGTVWTFEVDPDGLPRPARDPWPAHFADEVALPLGGRLAWTSGSGAVAHDVYFGTSFPLPYRGRQTSTAYVPGALEIDRTYYWRIDEVSADGVRTGFTWCFRSKSGSLGR